MTDLSTLTAALLRFRDERNWQQFHTLKDLILSVNLEAAELMELTQWKTDAELAALKEDADFRQQLKDECADVLMYLLLVAEHGGIDLIEAAREKMAKNAVRYPVSQAWSSVQKAQPDTPSAERSTDSD